MSQRNPAKGWIASRRDQRRPPQSNNQLHGRSSRHRACRMREGDMQEPFFVYCASPWLKAPTEHAATKETSAQFELAPRRPGVSSRRVRKESSYASYYRNKEDAQAKIDAIRDAKQRRQLAADMSRAAPDLYEALLANNDLLVKLLDAGLKHDPAAAKAIMDQASLNSLTLTKARGESQDSLAGVV